MSTRRHSQFTFTAKCLLLAGLIVSSTSVSLADNLNAPPYAGLPNSLVVFWNELAPGEGDLGVIGFDTFDGGFPLTDEDGGEGPGNPALSITPGTFGDDYEFWTPNVVDPLPFKDVRVQVTWSGNSEPVITGVDGFDPSDGPVSTFGPFNHVVDPPDNPFATGYYYEDWLLEPNPDWDIVTISVPSGGLLHQVVIDTRSVPEPSTLALAGLSLLLAHV